MGAFARASFTMHRELWPELQEQADVDIQVRETPELRLFLSAQDVDAQEEEITLWAQTDGFSIQWLGPEEVCRLEPRINPRVHRAALLEHIAMLDSYRYTLALAQAAERLGATFVNGEVTGLTSSAGRVSGVRLRHGDIACGTVVVALGPWSGQASTWLGMDIPVEPLKGQMIYLEGLDPPLEYCIHGPCYVVHKPDGVVWIGATIERAGEDTGTTGEARDLLMGQALELVPSLNELGMLRQTACLRPATPDSMPILGAAPGCDGVYLATGAENKGILLSPAMGRAVADLILDGETALPIATFAPERFAA
jgi:glycine/D-amino acid oxidase-like deaminating enzyme